jgi:DNA-binding protein WhiA
VTPLSEEARSELAAIVPARRCDGLAELSALFHTAGSLHLHGQGVVSLHLDLADPAVARRAFSLLRERGVASEIRTYRRHAFRAPMRYQLVVEGDPLALQVLHEAGVVSARGAPLLRPPRRVAGRACCRGAYLRGALLGAGSVSGPQSAHLEVRCANRESAEYLARTAARGGVELSIRERSRHVVVYAKRLETIADTLALAGASDAALLLDEQAVVGAARARANRLANADHANLVRSSRAAHQQLRAVRALERAGRLGTLPDPLREIAELRLRYPSSSLAELGRKCRPPASKAAAHRRLRRLASIADG